MPSSSSFDLKHNPNLPSFSSSDLIHDLDAIIFLFGSHLRLPSYHFPSQISPMTTMHISFSSLIFDVPPSWPIISVKASSKRRERKYLPKCLWILNIYWDYHYFLFQNISKIQSIYHASHTTKYNRLPLVKSILYIFNQIIIEKPTINGLENILEYHSESLYFFMQFFLTTIFFYPSLFLDIVSLVDNQLISAHL